MKILYVSHEYPQLSGGVGAGLSLIAEELSKQGNEIAILTLRDNFVSCKYLNIYEIKTLRGEKQSYSFLSIGYLL